MPKYATADRVARDELLEFVRPRHHGVLVTRRASGVADVAGDVRGRRRRTDRDRDLSAAREGRQRPPRPAGLDLHLTPTSGTARTCRSTAPPRCSTCPTPLEPLVDYFRCISGEHPNWDEYREAMRSQGKCLLRITPQQWGPVATGGFPPPE